MIRRVRRFIIGLLALAATACTQPEDTGSWVETAGEVVITNNGGGTILAFTTERARLLASGKKVVLKGYCASSCTIFYSLPNACMAKGSYLAFHGAKAMIGIGETVGNSQLAKHYRAGIKGKFLAEWKNVTKPLVKVQRAEVKALDPATKFCED